MKKEVFQDYVNNSVARFHREYYISNMKGLNSIVMMNREYKDSFIDIKVMKLPFNIFIVTLKEYIIRDILRGRKNIIITIKWKDSFKLLYKN